MRTYIICFLSRNDSQLFCKQKSCSCSSRARKSCRKRIVHCDSIPGELIKMWWAVLMALQIKYPAALKKNECGVSKSKTFAIKFCVCKRQNKNPSIFHPERPSAHRKRGTADPFKRHRLLMFATLHIRGFLPQECMLFTIELTRVLHDFLCVVGVCYLLFLLLFEYRVVKVVLRPLNAKWVSCQQLGVVITKIGCSPG